MLEHFLLFCVIQFTHLVCYCIEFGLEIGVPPKCISIAKVTSWTSRKSINCGGGGGVTE